MKKEILEAIKHRRSYYAISNRSPVSDEIIIDIIKTVVTHTPSAFNSQSCRVVLLLGENHHRLWNIVKKTLETILPEESFVKTEAKINTSFAAGYGTALFFEDSAIVETLQKKFPLYSENFPVWSLQSSAMHQYLTWVLLEDAGLGASLQHYNPLIDEEVRKSWGLPHSWKLIAQMPFGTPVEEPGEKKFGSTDTRVLVFK